MSERRFVDGQFVSDRPFIRDNPTRMGTLMTASEVLKTAHDDAGSRLALLMFLQGEITPDAFLLVVQPDPRIRVVDDPLEVQFAENRNQE